MAIFGLRILAISACKAINNIARYAIIFLFYFELGLAPEYITAKFIELVLSILHLRFDRLAFLPFIFQRQKLKSFDYPQDLLILLLDVSLIQALAKWL